MKNYGLNDPEVESTPSYIPKFETPNQFIEEKIKMLRSQFKITPTDEEINHLYDLKTEYEINAAVKTILNNHWK